MRATVHDGRGMRAMEVDAIVLALPATTLRRVSFTPMLPPLQRTAIARLAYGPATKTLLQFSRRFWRSPGSPRAIGSALPWGSLWDGNEEQPGRPGILSLLAGGSASAATQALTARAGPEGLAAALDWLGAGRAAVVAARQVTWEHDPWSGGGYACFDPGFDPAWRAWLARPTDTVFFAGEHTSIEWQGYMNGALESGQRAAAEVLATFAPGGCRLPEPAAVRRR